MSFSGFTCSSDSGDYRVCRFIYKVEQSGQTVWKRGRQTKIGERTQRSWTTEQV